MKVQRFGSWILLPSSDIKGGRGQKTYLLGPLVELASDLDQVYNLDDDGQSAKEQLYIF
jgi:hypothetical protein